MDESKQSTEPDRGRGPDPLFRPPSLAILSTWHLTRPGGSIRGEVLFGYRSPFTRASGSPYGRSRSTRSMALR